MLIDLHTHTFMSDGALLPSEHVRRAWVAGYRAVALTDHADISNIESLMRKQVPLCKELSAAWPIQVLPGVELTHVPPEHIDRLTQLARSFGAKIVVMHGETPVEPVPPGTNRAAIEARVDILAHPGILAEDDAQRAAELGVALEISARRGHCLGNGRVANLGRKFGNMLVIDSDAHGPGDFLSEELHRKVGLGAGLSEEEYAQVCRNSEALLERLLK
jgi:histidinol phosphatase-like PHP family hydrolase